MHSARRRNFSDPQMTMKGVAVFFVLVLVLDATLVLGAALPTSDGSGVLVRQRRQNRGSVGVDVHREKGVGTVVTAQGDRNLWKSKDGRTRLDAEAQWSKVFNGPAAGKPSYSGFVTFTHKF